jgi:hypothetical protein
MSSFASPDPSAPQSKHKKHSSPLRWWASPRATAFVALAIAMIAVAVAIAAWVRPSFWHSFSDEQSAQAKVTVCAAWAPVRKSVWVGTPNPRPGDPVAADAVAANVRLAMLGGGSFLKETLAAEPAAATDLAKAVNSVAITLEWMGINYLAGNQSHGVLDPLKDKLDSEGAEIDKLCG